MPLMPLILGILVVSSFQRSSTRGKHVMRGLTFCQLEEADAGFDLSFDGDELWYVEPYTYVAHQRLPEFAKEWQLKDSLAVDTYYSVGTCFYNIPRCVKGEKYPPPSIVPPTTVLYAQKQVQYGVRNTLICFVTDFHPAPVNITWLRNAKPVSELDISQTQYYSNSDYSFRVYSYLEFVPESGDVYSCSVTHPGLSGSLTRFWEMELDVDSQSVEVTVCVFGVLLGVLGIAAGLTLIIKAHRC